MSFAFSKLIHSKSIKGTRGTNMTLGQLKKVRSGSSLTYI